MKTFLFTCSIAFYCFTAFSQTLTQNINNRLIQKDEAKSKTVSLSLKDHDFSPLFFKTENSYVYGFIGEHYQRLRIKFITVARDTTNPAIYQVYGKSMVKNNICEFKGTMNISSIRKYKTIDLGVDSSYKNKGLEGQYVVSGTYVFKENETQAKSGVFTGNFQSNFYLDKNSKIHYDDISVISDGFTNNQFVGKWNSYKGTLTEQCNWGDYRIPNSGDLDGGAGEFSPIAKYAEYGWQTVNAKYYHNKKNQAIEYAKWWK
jgi:hypothetical protein